MNGKLACSVIGLVLALVPPAVAAELIGQARVVDGDTIEIHSQRIRLHGIDAPESSQTCLRAGRPERCGQIAANALADRIGRQTVRCEQHDVDRYRRIVAVCWAGATDLNGWMVEQGLAIAYRRYSLDYVAAEARARSARRGIWGTTFDDPAEYRRQHPR